MDTFKHVGTVQLRLAGHRWRILRVVFNENRAGCGFPAAVRTELGLKCSNIPPAASPAQYVTAGVMEQVIEQYGLVVHGEKHAALYIGCTGQGIPGGQQTDPKLGIEQPSYGQFLCIVKVAGAAQLSEIHVQLTKNGGYTWQEVA